MKLKKRLCPGCDSRVCKCDEMKNKKEEIKWCCESAERGMGHTCHMKPKHTPTPWKYIGAGNNCIIVKQVLNDFQPILAKNLTEQDARFICKAVNAYEKDQEIIKELLAASKEAMQALQHWGNKAESYEKANDPIRLAAHAKLSAAIAKAEGKSNV